MWCSRICPKGLLCACTLHEEWARGTSRCCGFVCSALAPPAVGYWQAEPNRASSAVSRFRAAFDALCFVLWLSSSFFAPLSEVFFRCEQPSKRVCDHVNFRVIFLVVLLVSALTRLLLVTVAIEKSLSTLVVCPPPPLFRLRQRVFLGQPFGYVLQREKRAK